MNQLPEDWDALLPLAYSELRRIARGQRRRIGSATLNTTALVHEAYLAMAKATAPDYESNDHFLAVAAVAMRRLLISEARRHGAQKRGGGQRPLSLEDRDVAVRDQSERLLDLDRALDELGGFNQRLQQVVECRFFGGLTEQETARALGVSDRTVRRDWEKARAWLEMRLGEGFLGAALAEE